MLIIFLYKHFLVLSSTTIFVLSYTNNFLYFLIPPFLVISIATIFSTADHLSDSRIICFFSLKLIFVNFIHKNDTLIMHLLRKIWWFLYAGLKTSPHPRIKTCHNTYKIPDKARYRVNIFTRKSTTLIPLILKLLKEIGVSVLKNQSAMFQFLELAIRGREDGILETFGEFLETSWLHFFTLQRTLG